MEFTVEKAQIERGLFMFDIYLYTYLFIYLTNEIRVVISHYFIDLFVALFI